MLQLFTLNEATVYLTEKSGNSWSESMIFDIALRLDIDLKAAPPRDTKVAIWKFEIGKGLVKKASGLPWSLAILHPQSIIELWQTGETEVLHAVQPFSEADDEQYHWFEEPVVVSMRDVRVTSAAIKTILENSTSPSAQEKPIETRERNTLLSIIGVLCKEAGHDITKPAKAASTIQSTAASMGISIGETTIEMHIKKVIDALATRTK